MIRKFSTIFILLIITFSSCQQNATDNEFASWSPTPPMGWNSWDCYGSTVTEAEVKANADYMAENMKDYGWEYIVVDIRWFVENDKAGGYNQTDPIYIIDEFGRYLPTVNRFPSANNGTGFKPLADYIHKKGLKFGIHIMRGIPKIAVENKLPIKGTNSITADQIYSLELQCEWLRDNYTILADKPGAQEYYNTIFELYASWGVDFVKVDDLSRPYHKAEIELIRNAIDNCGRPIVLSTSPGETPIDAAEHVQNHANMWRMVDDVWDTWPHIAHLFDVCEKWYPYIGNGTWPDCDMIPMGRISIRGERGEDRMTRLNKDEQYTLMTLWTIFRSPLMFGGDLPSNDEFTLDMLTNSEVLYVLNHSTNNQILKSECDQKIWIAEDTQSDDIFVALFAMTDNYPIDTALALYNSDLITYKTGDQTTKIDVDIKGSNKLYLVVSNGDGSKHWDHADWIEPTLIGENGSLSLTDLDWNFATSGSGDVFKNRNTWNLALQIGDKTYKKGIGTHAESIIEYDIPDGYDRFSTLVGLDKQCIEHTDGATVRFHVFDQYPTGIPPQDSLEIELDFKELGLSGNYIVRDLWGKEDLGEFSDQLSLVVKNHGARLVRLRKMK